MPTKKVAPKKKKPDKFVFEISDLKLIGQPVHKEFEGAPPARPPHSATAHAPGWHGASGHGIFTGRVSNVDKASGYFTVSYEDGDDEVRLGVGRVGVRAALCCRRVRRLVTMQPTLTLTLTLTLALALALAAEPYP